MPHCSWQLLELTYCLCLTSTSKTLSYWSFLRLERRCMATGAHGTSVCELLYAASDSHTPWNYRCVYFPVNISTQYVSYIICGHKIEICWYCLDIKTNLVQNNSGNIQVMKFDGSTISMSTERCCFTFVRKSCMSLFFGTFLLCV